VARHHAGLGEIGPHGGQVFLLHAEQVDALAAGDLDGGHLVFLGGVGDGAQLGGVVRPPHMRGTTE
jgi:hypothetical protein